MSDERQPDQVSLSPGAEGMDLYAGTDSNPPDTRRIRWVREADGSVVASMYAWSGNGDANLDIRSTAKSGSVAQTIIDAISDVDNIAQIELNGDPANPSIIARVEDSTGRIHDVLIIDASGLSDFQLTAQKDIANGYAGLDGNTHLPSSELPIPRGSVTAAGAKAFGTGFSVARTGGAPTGDYTVTYDTALPLAAVVLLSANQNAQLQSNTVNGFRYTTSSYTTGALVDAGCRFGAIPQA